jgi:hypothetical protein
MRETRQSGSEGGGIGTTDPPYPYHGCAGRHAGESWMAALRPTRHGGRRPAIVRP